MDRWAAAGQDGAVPDRTDLFGETPASAPAAAEAAGLRFTALSAVFSGVADLKRAFDEARARKSNGQCALLFADEIHRVNRARQDGFRPGGEDGTVTPAGATAANPSFALNGALLPRCQAMVPKRLDDAALEVLPARTGPLDAAAPATPLARRAAPCDKGRGEHHDLCHLSFSRLHIWPLGRLAA